jgi:hypothetical protein
LIGRPWRPAPAPASMQPRSVVIRRPSPRLGADPGPTNRLNPGPASVRVRPPVGVGLVRGPNVAVLGVVSPGPITVEPRRHRLDGCR